MFQSIWNFISTYFGASMASWNVSGVRNNMQEAMGWINSSDPNFSYFSDLYSIFAAPAIALLLIYFSMDLFDKLAAENFTIDTLILDFAKIIAGVALINNGIYIMQGLYGISELVCDYIEASLTGAADLTFSTTVPSATPTSTWDILVMVFEGITSAGGVASTSFSFIEVVVMHLVQEVCISIIAYQRAVRIGMRVIVSPLVMADVVGHGINNGSMHYLKTIFALCMEGPIICLSVAFLPLALSGASTVGVAFMGIALALVVVKLMFGANKMAKELFV